MGHLHWFCFDLFFFGFVCFSFVLFVIKGTNKFARLFEWHNQFSHSLGHQTGKWNIYFIDTHIHHCLSPEFRQKEVDLKKKTRKKISRKLSHGYTHSLLLTCSVSIFVLLVTKTDKCGGIGKTFKDYRVENPSWKSHKYIFRDPFECMNVSMYADVSNFFISPISIRCTLCLHCMHGWLKARMCICSHEWFGIQQTSVNSAKIFFMCHQIQ